MRIDILSHLKFIPIRSVFIVCATFVWLALITIGTTSQIHASQSMAIDAVERLNEDVGNLLIKYAQSENSSEFENKALKDGLTAIFKKSLDIEAISQSVIGAAWRQATPRQRQNFQLVFTDYLAQKYSSHFPKFVGSQFSIVGAEEIKKNYFMIMVNASINNNSTDVKWYVLKRRGQYRIVNIALSDTSILNVERRVIRSLLQQRAGNLDRLITYLPNRYSDR